MTDENNYEINLIVTLNMNINLIDECKFISSTYIIIKESICDKRALSHGYYNIISIIHGFKIDCNQSNYPLYLLKNDENYEFQRKKKL